MIQKSRWIQSSGWLSCDRRPRLTAERAENAEVGEARVSGEGVFAKTPSPAPSPKTPIWLAVGTALVLQSMAMRHCNGGKRSGLSLHSSTPFDHSRLTVTKQLRVFAGGGAGPLGVWPTMLFDAPCPQLTYYLCKGITSRARAPFCKKRVPPHSLASSPSLLSSAVNSPS